MDLNDLFFNEQLSLLRAMDAGSPELRARHARLARDYGERIAAYRADKLANPNAFSLNKLNLHDLLK
ncbi:hypothetical protein [Rhizorhapis sp. SPR117]|uniref:hypothetical protein n=1 Tax=Rhizorhapis sp. SPR117 TaxID=2912611 RepID=UPI001F1EF1B8|nr:hypothetical protein [Rhizorhapis sp. SPR117]